MDPFTKRTTILALVGTVLVLGTVREMWAQPAPIPRAVVPVNAAPDAMRSLFPDLQSGDRMIRIEGAQWLQLQFSEFRLGDGQLKVSSPVDEQTFNQAQLEDWEGLTAVFNGSEVTITLTPDASGEISADVADVIIGLPGANPEVGPESAWQPLIELLGDDLERFIPDDARRQPDGPSLDAGLVPEAICGSVDDRVASQHPAVGRIMPIGCTGWIIERGRLLTAGHCISSSTKTIEFNVPTSTANGATVSPPVRDQYRIIAGSIVDEDTGAGSDWAVFRVLPNTETGLKPIEAQKASFTPSNTENPATVRITGYGLDGPPPGFGNSWPWNEDNQTQQTHTGRLTANAGGANRGTLRYTVDTQGGNSGSPVIVEGTDQAIGIHTHGGCSSDGGTNAGTSFRNEALWNAL